MNYICVWGIPMKSSVYMKSQIMSLFADETLLINVVCGILSGVMSSAIANPTDVLKVSSAFYIFRYNLHFLTNNKIQIMKICEYNIHWLCL